MASTMHCNNERNELLRVSLKRMMFADRLELDSRLTSAQKALTLQEDTIKQTDCERSQLVERINSIERNLAASHNEKQLLQVTLC